MQAMQDKKWLRVLLSAVVGLTVFALLMLLAGVSGIIDEIGQIELLLILLISCLSGYLFNRWFSKRSKLSQ